MHSAATCYKLIASAEGMR